MTTAGSSAVGSCNYGFSGSPTRSCTQNGANSPNATWGTISGPCTQVTCSASTTASVIYPTATVGLQNLTCNTDYYGFPTSNCTQSGTSGSWGTVNSPCSSIFLFFFFCSSSKFVITIPKFRLK